MILKQNLDVLLPNYIGTISFVFYFLEEIQRADWGAIAFGSWVDVISNRRPRPWKAVVYHFRRDFQSRAWRFHDRVLGSLGRRDGLAGTKHNGASVSSLYLLEKMENKTNRSNLFWD